MNCGEVQRILPELLESSAQDAEFGAHLKSCPACSELVEDLRLISSQARHLSAVDEPPNRVWVRIAAELRAEGIIREPQPHPAPVAVRPRRWSVWWLAPVAAALIAGASYLVTHKPAPTVATQTAPAVQTPSVAAPQSPAPSEQTVAQAPAPKVSQQPSQPKNHVRRDVEPLPSAEDQQFLSEVSQ